MLVKAKPERGRIHLPHASIAPPHCAHGGTACPGTWRLRWAMVRDRVGAALPDAGWAAELPARPWQEQGTRRLLGSSENHRAAGSLVHPGLAVLGAEAGWGYRSSARGAVLG